MASGALLEFLKHRKVGSFVLMCVCVCVELHAVMTHVLYYLLSFKLLNSLWNSNTIIRMYILFLHSHSIKFPLLILILGLGLRDWSTWQGHLDKQKAIKT